MPNNIPNNMKDKNTRDLTYRYLLWLYKTLKEELDRVERKFTQLEVDREIGRYILKNAHLSQIDDDIKFRELCRDWKEYTDKKESDGRALKYSGDKWKAEYYFLMLKFEAVKKIITKLFSKKALDNIHEAYEDQMRQRILESREHT